jgi:flagellar hook-basal body complex protein FliE
MTVNLAAGIAAYTNAAKGLALQSTGSNPVGDGSGFGDLLKNAVEGAIDTQKTGEAASLSAITGKADINAVVTAVNNAEFTLQTVLAVRDKVVQAYQQVLQMAV